MPLSKLQQQQLEFGNEVNGVDSGLYSHLSMKVKEGQELREEAKIFLEPNKQFKFDELQQMAILVRITNTYKVQIDELEQLEALVDSFLLLVKVYSIFFNTETLGVDDLEAGNFLALKGKTLFDLTFDCVRQAKGNGLAKLSKSKVSSLKEICDQFRQISEKNSSPSLKDSFFSLIFTSLNEVLDKQPLQGSPERQQNKRPLQTASNINGVNTNLTEERLYIEEAQAVSLSSNDLKEENARIKEWEDEYHEYLRRNPQDALTVILEGADSEELDYVLVLEELNELKEEAERLINIYKEEIPTNHRQKNLASDNQALERLVKLLDWAVSAIQTKRQVFEDKEQVEASQLRWLAEKIEEMKLLKGTNIAKIISEWYKAMKNARSELNKVYKSPNLFLRDTMKAKDILSKMSNMVDFNGMKILKEVMKRIEKVVKVTEENENVDRDLERCQHWENDFNTFAEDFQEYDNESLAVESTMNKMQRTLAGLKKALVELKARPNKSKENITLDFVEWILRAIELLKGEDKTANYEEWKDLLEDGRSFEDIKGYKERVSELLVEVQDQVERTGVIRLLAGKVRNNQKVTLFEVRSALENLGRHKIKLTDDKKLLEKELREALRVKEDVEKFLSNCRGSRRSDITEFKDIKSRVDTLSIKLEEEELQLDKIIKQGETLKEEVLKRVKEISERRKNLKEINSLFERYKSCVVYIKEIEELQKLMEKASPIVDFIKVKQRELGSYEQEVSLQDLIEVEKKLEFLERSMKSGSKDLKKSENIIDQELKALKRDIFIKKCEIITKGAEGGDNIKPYNPVLYAVKPKFLNDLFLEGKSFSWSLKGDVQMSQSIASLKELIKKVDEALGKINKAKSLQQIEEILRSVPGTVDVVAETENKREEIRLQKSLEERRREEAANERLKKNLVNKSQNTSKDKKLAKTQLNGDHSNEREKEKEREAEKRADTFQRTFLKNEKPKESLKESGTGLWAYFKKDEFKRRAESPEEEKVSTKALAFSNMNGEDEEPFKNNIPKSSIRSSKFSEDTLKYGKANKSPVAKFIVEEQRRKSSVDKPRDSSIHEKRKNLGVPKAPKNKHEVLVELKDLLEGKVNNETVSLLDFFAFCKTILKGFPEILEKSEEYTKLIGQLTIILDYEQITKSLVNKKFEKEYLSELIQQDNEGLRLLEEKLERLYKQDSVTKVTERDRILNDKNNELEGKERNEREGRQANQPELKDREGKARDRLDEIPKDVNDTIKDSTISEDRLLTPFRPLKENVAKHTLTFADRTSTASTFGKVSEGTTAKKLLLDKELPHNKLSIEPANAQEDRNPEISKRLAFDKCDASVLKVAAPVEKNNVENITSSTVKANEPKERNITTKSMDPRVYKQLSTLQKSISPQQEIVKDENSPKVQNPLSAQQQPIVSDTQQTRQASTKVSEIPIEATRKGEPCSEEKEAKMEGTERVSVKKVKHYIILCLTEI